MVKLDDETNYNYTVDWFVLRAQQLLSFPAKHNILLVDASPMMNPQHKLGYVI